MLDNGDEVLVEGTEVIVLQGKHVAPAGGASLDGDDAAKIAGVQGDALKAITTLGAVARTPVGAQGISVWGASPEDTQLYIDRIPVPRLFHLGGTRSVLPSHAVATLGLIPGGAGAQYGRGIGGVVQVKTAAASEGSEFLLHVDPFDVGLSASVRLSPASWVAMSSRASLLLQVVDAAAPKGSNALIPIPEYSDTQLRGGLQLSKRTALSFLALASVDHLERGIPSLLEGQEFRELSDSQFFRVGVTLTKETPGHVYRATLWAGQDDDSQRLEFPSLPVLDEQRVRQLGVFLNQAVEVGDSMSVQVGVDALWRQSNFIRSGALTLPKREGDIVPFGQEPGNRINEDRWTIDSASLGGFAVVQWQASETLHIEPGLRFEPSVVSGKRILPVRPSEPEVGYTELQFALDPRLRIELQATPTLQFFSALGRYHQAAAHGDGSPVFGNPRLQQREAWQLVVGNGLHPASWLRVEMLAFFVEQSKLVVRSESATPPIAGLLRSTGEGRSVGAQLSVRVDLDDFYASLSYTALSALRRADSLSLWRRFDSEQPHALRVAGQWQFRKSFSLGARWNLFSGEPRTAVVGAVFDAGSQKYDPIFGEQNQQRLPMFSELSLRLGYQRRVGMGDLRVWLDVVNATNRKNTEELFYSSDFRQKGAIIGLPILAVVGAELRL